jgi:hypothetical protein
MPFFRLFDLFRVCVCGGAVVIAIGSVGPVSAAELLTPQQAAATIDGFLESHWHANQIQPAAVTDDATFLRRLTLDLAGRIPTVGELEQFLSDPSADKRAKAIERLVSGPEFPLHLGTVLDPMIQGRYAGDAEFVDYLRRGLRDEQSWSELFRELMLGPWETDAVKPAMRFLDKRVKASDVLAVDTARAFFGVDISCAKCHDHPLVDDWKQEHFYGMVAFFHRTTGGKGKISEKDDGEVMVLAANGEQQVARLMFLSGDVIDEPTTAAANSSADKTPKFSRREQLVRVALEQRAFFSRAIVNQFWEYLFGRGLVDPVDQMHSGNPPAVPGLLEWLAEDFAASGYHLRRLMIALVSTRAYQLSSRWEQDSPAPQSELFAAAALRPLTPQQLAFSLVLATGNGKLAEPDEVQSRVERYAGVAGLARIEQYLTIEKRASGLLASLDSRRRDYQTSVAEALFLSNNPAPWGLISGGEDRFATQLAEIPDRRQLVAAAIRTILSREPGAEELNRLSEWLAGQGDDRLQAAEQLVWVLVTSAEFRFNH